MSVIKAGLAVGLVIVGGALVAAHQAQQPAQPDVLPALLEEVRGLRAAMEQMASAGPRIQLFTSRLQLQEARVNNMIRRLDTVRDALGSAQREVAHLQGQQQEREAAITELQSSGAPEAREAAKQAAFEVEQIKRAAAAARATADRYTAEEAQLTGDIATEQARWSEINGRLDDLEKLLSSRR
jgi:chromosome segregation ATPase